MAGAMGCVKWRFRAVLEGRVGLIFSGHSLCLIRHCTGLRDEGACKSSPAGVQGRVLGFTSFCWN